MPSGYKPGTTGSIVSRVRPRGIRMTCLGRLGAGGYPQLTSVARQREGLLSTIVHIISRCSNINVYQRVNLDIAETPRYTKVQQCVLSENPCSRLASFPVKACFSMMHVAPAVPKKFSKMYSADSGAGPGYCSFERALVLAGDAMLSSDIAGAVVAAHPHTTDSFSIICAATQRPMAENDVHTDFTAIGVDSTRLILQPASSFASRHPWPAAAAKTSRCHAPYIHGHDTRRSRLTLSAII